MTAVQNNPDEWGKPDGTMLQSEDDWATPPPDTVHDALFKTWTIELCKSQLEIHKSRQTNKGTAIQRYFNSTQARNAFARLMLIGAHVNELYTVSAIATELCITRQAAHVMVHECLDAGWVEQVPNVTSVKAYRGTQELIDGFNAYAVTHLAAIETGKLHDSIAALLSYRKLRKAS